MVMVCCSQQQSFHYIMPKPGNRNCMFNGWHCQPLNIQAWQWPQNVVLTQPRGAISRPYYASNILNLIRMRTSSAGFWQIALGRRRQLRGQKQQQMPMFSWARLLKNSRSSSPPGSAASKRPSWWLTSLRRPRWTLLRGPNWHGGYITKVREKCFVLFF